ICPAMVTKASRLMSSGSPISSSSSSSGSGSSISLAVASAAVMTLDRAGRGRLWMLPEPERHTLHMQADVALGKPAGKERSRLGRADLGHPLRAGKTVKMVRFRGFSVIRQLVSGFRNLTGNLTGLAAGKIHNFANLTGLVVGKILVRFIRAGFLSVLK